MLVILDSLKYQPPDTSWIESKQTIFKLNVQCNYNNRAYDVTGYNIISSKANVVASKLPEPNKNPHSLLKIGSCSVTFYTTSQRGPNRATCLKCFSWHMNQSRNFLFAGWVLRRGINNSGNKRCELPLQVQPTTECWKKSHYTNRTHEIKSVWYMVH